MLENNDEEVVLRTKQENRRNPADLLTSLRTMKPKTPL